MRYTLAAAIIFSSAIPGLARDKPLGECSASFISRWQADKVAVVDGGQTPKKPCLMRTETGPYVCDRDGCTRSDAYSQDQ